MASVGEFIEFLSPGLKRGGCPPWPPDAFAVCASLLQRTGAYAQMVDPARGCILESQWPEQARKLGEDWRKALETRLKTRLSARPRLFKDLMLKTAAPATVFNALRLPRELGEWWSDLRNCAQMRLADVPQNKELSKSLLRLCLVADEACGGVGLGPDKTLALILAEIRLRHNDFRSLGWSVLPDKALVLPKQHTPKVGLTLRSLSHNLALCPSGEVAATWRIPYSLEKGQNLDVMNLLLVPWPLELTVKDFSVLGDRPDLAPLVEPYRYFNFRRRHRDTAGFESFLRAAFEQARRFVGHVHAVVFPELALTKQEYLKAEKIALAERAMLIAGVLKSETTNACMVQPAGLLATPSRDLLDGLRIEQRKHHRWCLDRKQILQYGLGGVLPASKGCWELTEIFPRELIFFTITGWLTVSVLICEDLARQEPAAEILRAVGPNLVIALLMDGPQLRNRWPAHYAGVLAEDPGCSVLTLTSLGMSRMSRPREGELDRSRTVAFWRDARLGDHEVELRETENACVLSLVCESHEEFTADCRSDRGQTHYPVFGGLHRFKVSADASRRRVRTAKRLPRPGRVRTANASPRPAKAPP